MPQSAPTQGNLKLYLSIVLLGTYLVIFNLGNQQIEQQITILKSKLVFPKRRNPKAGGSLGRATTIDVNHLPLKLDKLFKKVVYHVDVQFTPDLPKRLLR